MRALECLGVCPMRSGGIVRMYDGVCSLFMDLHAKNCRCYDSSVNCRSLKDAFLLQRVSADSATREYYASIRKALVAGALLTCLTLSVAMGAVELCLQLAHIWLWVTVSWSICVHQLFSTADPSGHSVTSSRADSKKLRARAIADVEPECCVGFGFVCDFEWQIRACRLLTIAPQYYDASSFPECDARDVG